MSGPILPGALLLSVVLLLLPTLLARGCSRERAAKAPPTGAKEQRITITVAPVAGRDVQRHVKGEGGAVSAVPTLCA
jgi:hypothetical protein